MAPVTDGSYRPAASLSKALVAPYFGLNPTFVFPGPEPPLVMTRKHWPALGLGLALAACGGDPIAPPPPPPPGQGCATPQAVALAAGQHTIVDPTASAGCVRLPAAGVAGAEYLVVALSTSGTQGVSEAYKVDGQTVATPSAPAPLPPPVLQAFRRPTTAQAFHSLMRDRERLLAADPRTALSRLERPALTPPPVPGSKRTFNVCATLTCTTFVQVTATAAYVGTRGAIYLDDVVPAGGFNQADIDTLGLLFDGGAPGQNMYAVDTAAFGREPDSDGNSVVVMLLTDQLNTLSGNCNTSGTIILGFFNPADLIPTAAGSNRGEVFYALVPSPGSQTCDVSKNFVKTVIPGVFIHEFQHMINFNQKVLVRGGASSEETWLNEGLSHFAEELGGRIIPDGPGQGSAPNRFSQFVGGNVSNAYDYLENPEATFLVGPSSSTGTLPERGAGWLFTRWLADHFGADPNGSAVTRGLVITPSRGAGNVTTVTGETFPTLVAEWQMANFLDNLPGFTPSSARLQYTSWNFRTTFASANAQDPGNFPRVYPLLPDSTRTGTYLRTGTLRAGSGRHVRVIQNPSAGAVDLLVTNSAGAALSPTTVPRVGVVRIR